MDRRNFLKVSGMAGIALGAGLPANTAFKRITASEIIEAVKFHAVMPDLVGRGKRFPDKLVFMYRRGIKWLDIYDLQGYRHNKEVRMWEWQGEWPTAYWAGFVTTLEQQRKDQAFAEANKDHVSTVISLDNFVDHWKKNIDKIEQAHKVAKRALSDLAKENLHRLKTEPIEHPHLVQQGIEDAYRVMSEWEWVMNVSKKDLMG